jgi:lipopolysaccharide transport system ATP-binding protein
MSSEVAVRVSNLSKCYQIYGAPQDRLKQFVLPKLGGMFGGASRSYFREFWALRDVSFEIKRGEAVGIIGRNGSGKSTLLQMVCGTLQPTEGTVEVGGRVAALLELGAGFNPEFTGRENVYLNGSLLGMRRAEIEEAFPAILEFAEIGEYIDRPVKTYSSGMYVRLAFAVAVHCKPEVLIVDEALAVGDVYFQRKCYRRIEQLRAGGCTLLLVTHSMDSLIQVCDRGILLEHGEVMGDGDCQKVVHAYMRSLFGVLESAEPGPADAAVGELGGDAEDATLEANGLEPNAFLMKGGMADLFATRAGYNRDEIRLGTRDAVCADFVIVSEKGWSSSLWARYPFSLWVKYVARRDVDRVVFGLQVRTVDGLVVYSTNSLVFHNELFSLSKDEVKLVRFDLRCALLPAQYFLTIGVSRYEDGGEEVLALDRRVDSVILTVFGDNHHTNGVADMEASICIGGDIPKEVI